jgi:hypothetical protein
MQSGYQSSRTGRQALAKIRMAMILKRASTSRPSGDGAMTPMTCSQMVPRRPRHEGGRLADFLVCT